MGFCTNKNYGYKHYQSGKSQAAEAVCDFSASFI